MPASIAEREQLRKLSGTKVATYFELTKYFAIFINRYLSVRIKDYCELVSHHLLKVNKFDYARLTIYLQICQVCIATYNVVGIYSFC